MLQSQGKQNLTGTVIDHQEGKKDVMICFEPFIPIETSHYQFDNKFHTEALTELVESGENWGIIVMDDRTGLKIGRLKYTTLEVLEELKYSDVPPWEFYKKAAELATTCYVDSSNVKGLIIAAGKRFWDPLIKELSPWLQSKIVKKVEIYYGGNIGFNIVNNL